MSHKDVSELLEIERSGVRVVSWQIAKLWDSCKLAISNDEDALLLSKLLRIQQHHYLSELARAEATGVPDLLVPFLQLDHAYRRIELIGFDSAKLTFESAHIEKRQDGYAISRAARVARIAFDSIRSYSGRARRNLQFVSESLVAKQLKSYMETLISLQNLPSEPRGPLIQALVWDAPAEIRDAKIAEVLGLSPPSDQVRQLRDSLQLLLSAQSDILIERFGRGESVAWDDFADS
jgi:hypothetical protein